MILIDPGQSTEDPTRKSAAIDRSPVAQAGLSNRWSPFRHMAGGVVRPAPVARLSAVRLPGCVMQGHCCPALPRPTPTTNSIHRRLSWLASGTRPSS